MKKLFLPLITAFLFVSATPVLAQETLPTEEVGVEAQGEIIKTADLFDVEIEVGTQSPWTKRVPVTIRFRSTIDADQVGISWDAPVSLDLVQRHESFISVVKGEVYSAKVLVKPEQVGSYSIAGNVTAWQYNTNYVSSASTSITFDEDGITVPQTAGYTGAVAIMYVAVGILSIIGLAVLAFGVKIGFKKLKIWLTPPR